MRNSHRADSVGMDDELPTELDRSRAELSHPLVLVMWDGGCVSREVRAGDQLVIGRAAESDIVVDHSTVSRRHALLSVGVPSRIEDLGSANGIRLGDVVLRRESAVLEPGQAVEVGAALLVVHAALQGRDGEPPHSEVSTSKHPTTLEGAMVVNDDETRRIHETLALVAKSTLPVLLQGETGVGKDGLAETIHRQSPRAARPFVRVNCAAMPSALLESELFGYERGAFTGAARAKVGLVESADGGTIFLDEIGEMEATMQAKLLHVLERGEVMRLGSLRPRPVDVRFVAATNRDVESLVASGAFRKDLYFRLKGIGVMVPPLAARVKEIAPMAALFLGRACANLKRASLQIAPDALECLQRYPWPGNVRELRNAMERAAVLCKGATVGVTDLPSECAHFAPLQPPAESAGVEDGGQPVGTPPSMREEVQLGRRRVERERIVAALERCSGNQSAAARALGISRRTLVARLAEYEIPRPIKDNRP
jgi:two-component system response regulator AtoC